MPSINFVLPHTIYWLGIILIPLGIVIMLFRRKTSSTPKYQASIAFLFWLCGGIMGLHRVYLKNFLAIIYIGLFVTILVANNQAQLVRTDVSNTKNKVFEYDFLIEQATEREPIERIEQLKNEQTEFKSNLATFEADYTRWNTISKWAFYLILFGLVIDLFLLKRLVARKTETIEVPKKPESQRLGCVENTDIKDVHNGEAPILWHPLATRFVNTINTANHFVGQYIAIWTLIAVFVFYYEVIVRYVFNSPTNWAHESMFLVFGMQYLFAGGFALKAQAHVRVDVFYMRLSKKNKARLDLITSVFFFLFTLVLMVTGFTFFKDAFIINEVSFTEWGVAYWPTKFAIFGGGVLLFLQGISNALSDIQTLKTA